MTGLIGSSALMGSDGAFSRLASHANGMANTCMMPLKTYDVGYPHRSALLPSAGWATTPPEESIKESNDKTVARCWDGISPFKNAWRTGVTAANSSDQTISKPSANQKLGTNPIRVS